MSRIGNKPVAIEDGVSVKIDGGNINVKGPAGELNFAYHPNMKVEHDAEQNAVVVGRPDDTRDNRALHGLTRALIANMVKGVKTPYEKRLEIVGVGYNAQLKGQKIALQVGFANTVEVEIPKGVTCELPDNTHIVVKSPDKQAVGQLAANIRAVRPPEPYKGKGIRYQDERVRRKAGKAFAK